jgi:hypothetical protein
MNYYAPHLVARRHAARFAAATAAVGSSRYGEKNGR